MAKKQKKQKKSGTKKKREKKYVAPEKQVAADEDYAASGTMGGMVSGFRRAVGASSDEEIKKRKNRWVDHIWTIVLLLAAVGILVWRFGGE